MVSVLLRYQIVGAPDPPMSDLPYRLHARRSFKTSSANGSRKSRSKVRGTQPSALFIDRQDHRHRRQIADALITTLLGSR